MISGHHGWEWGWYWEVGFFTMTPRLFSAPFYCPQTNRSFVRNTNQGWRWHIRIHPHPNLTLIPILSPHNHENSEKWKWENKHVLTIRDTVQLTVISNIYCKILTPISTRKGERDCSSTHKMHPFLMCSSSAPCRGPHHCPFIKINAKPAGLNTAFRPLWEAAKVGCNQA